MIGLRNPSFLAKLEALELTVRRVKWGARAGGRYAINRRGSSVEFADYSAYTPGDDIRSIDWSLHARLDKLFVKTYREEIELAVDVIIDATTSMGLPSRAKLDRAEAMGWCLAYVGVASHHHVRVSWVRPGALSVTPPMWQRGDWHRLASQQISKEPAGSVRLPEWMSTATAALRMRGGQAIVITDGMYPPSELFRALGVLRHRHMEVKLLQVLTDDELHPAKLFQGGAVIDSETGQARELGYRAEELEQAMLTHNDTLARYCLRNGIPFAQDRLQESLETFVLRMLPARGFLE